MRYHYLRFDIWACLAISVLLSFIPVKILEATLPEAYENYVEEHTVEDGAIGGIAGEEVVRAENIEDLLANDTFTVISPGIEYRNKGGGYYKNYYMHALTLPSGEKVAAIINGDSVQKTGESIYSGDSILPVGRIVYEDLTQNETFINQIEFKEELSRKDFYIDMMGEGGKVSEEDYKELPTTMAQLITVIIAFPILHMLGAKFGIFPYFFPPKNKKESEWE
ncbi:MAG: hypothetical protein HFJ54_08710 [Clostridia bacterium]|nr:hypothetical protein [Clostridia bacterium]